MPHLALYQWQYSSMAVVRVRFLTVISLHKSSNVRKGIFGAWALMQYDRNLHWAHFGQPRVQCFFMRAKTRLVKLRRWTGCSEFSLGAHLEGMFSHVLAIKMTQIPEQNRFLGHLNVHNVRQSMACTLQCSDLVYWPQRYLLTCASNEGESTCASTQFYRSSPSTRSTFASLAIRHVKSDLSLRWAHIPEGTFLRSGWYSLSTTKSSTSRGKQTL